jgi:alpha-galactosidase
MPKITFMGAGSTVFAKNIIGDSMCSDVLCDSHFALYDIDGPRLRESKMMLENLNKNMNQGRAKITAHLGVRARKTALRNANYVVNAIQVGGYDPCTIIDFEVPKKYGLRQTIADTLGIGGLFRSLRTIPIILDFAHDLEEVSPDAWFLNYANPMCTLTGSLLRGSSIKSVGLCHSVQGCARGLLHQVGLNPADYPRLQWHIAGINHQGWLLEISHDGKDLYPLIKKRAAAILKRERRKEKAEHRDLVRLEIMMQFGHYLTESSEHSAEYMPYWIKSSHPELIDQYNIPLDEYPRRCVNQIAGWEKMRDQLVNDANLTHSRTGEYGSQIMEAIETDIPLTVGGNVLNNGLVTNLPSKAVVEIACLVDRNGVQGTYVGDLPEQCAAINRTNINTQLLTLEAALEGRKDAIYHAAFLDPHTSAELTIDEIRSLCDDLIEAHGNWLPEYK